MSALIDDAPLGLDTTDFRQFLEGDKSSLSKLKSLTKSTFEFGGGFEKSAHSSKSKKRSQKSVSLDDSVLVTDGFNEEGVWDQLSGASGSLLSTLADRVHSHGAVHDKGPEYVNPAVEFAPVWRSMQYAGDGKDDAVLKHSGGGKAKKKKKADFSLWDSDEDEDADESEDNVFEAEEEVKSDGDLNEMQQFLDKQFDKSDSDLGSDIDENTKALLKSTKTGRKKAGIIDSDEDDEDDTDSDASDGDDAAVDKLTDEFEDEDWFNLKKSKFPTDGGSDVGKTETAEDRADSGDEEWEALSGFEREQRRMAKSVSVLEKDNMKEKPWEMQGETGARKLMIDPKSRKTTEVIVEKRPKNAMLETYLDFDYSDKLKPTITDEITAQIERVLVERIVADRFDDVSLRVDPSKLTPKARRKLVEINDRKSAMGLAELYERQYLQQVDSELKTAHEAEGGEASKAVTKEERELAKKHAQISRLKSDLFYSLDLLCRFHYTPKGATIADNIKVKTHSSALFMEEMLPTAQAAIGDMTLAPEEIYAKPKNKWLVGDSEMSKLERARKRKANKKRGYYKKDAKQRRDTVRAKYDARFKDHLSRIQSLNEVRTHAMAAARRDGMLPAIDETKYTSSKQVFGKIMEAQSRAKKRKEASGTMEHIPDAKRIKLIRSHM